MTHLPSNWELGALGDHIELLTGFPFQSSNYSNDRADIRLLRGDNIVQNALRWADVKRWRVDGNPKLPRYELEAGDVVLAMDRPWTKAGLKFAVIRAEDLPCLLVQRVARIRGRGQICTPFAAQLLASHRFTSHVKGVQTETAIPHISSEQIREFLVPLPPLPEQRKIADILSTWDEALEKLDALIAAKDRRKQALMQQLLTGRKRVKGFTEKWKTVTLGEVLAPITRPVPKPSTKFLAAGIRSHGKGVFLKPDFAPDGIALDELFELRAGDLVVNITFAWEGAAAIVSAEANGALVSHRFPTFEFVAGKSERSFFRHYILFKRFVFDCGLSSPGGAGRNRVLSKSAFLGIELRLPSAEEQQRIGEILDSVADEIAILRRQRNALDQQKRGLMQRLLTGKIRVAVAP